MKAINVGLEYHLFRLAEKKDAWYYSNGKKMRWDKKGKSGTELSEEFDLICKYKVNAYLELMVGYGIFFPGTFIEKTGSHQNAQWLFTQLQINI
ncbi:MAG: alginate export family protein [Pseudomonadota bacterium]